MAPSWLCARESIDLPAPGAWCCRRFKAVLTGAPVCRSLKPQSLPGGAIRTFETRLITTGFDLRAPDTRPVDRRHKRVGEHTVTVGLSGRAGRRSNAESTSYFTVNENCGRRECLSSEEQSLKLP